MRVPTSGVLTTLLGAGALAEIAAAPRVELEPPEVTCAHERKQRDLRAHENDDRIRVIEICRACALRWHHCYAKRPGHGVVGEWLTRVERMGAQPAPPKVLQITRLAGKRRKAKGR